MKKLRLPENNDEYIEISQITEDFCGLIIGYKKGKPYGYIQYISENDMPGWVFVNNVCGNIVERTNDTIYDSLEDLVQYTHECYLIDEYKVIEFEKY